MHLLFISAALLAAPYPEANLSLINRETAPVQWGLESELGFLAVLQHTIQFSRNGSTIDYVGEGGQDVLVPFVRLRADATLCNHHAIALTYQPLDIQTKVVTKRALQVDDATIGAGRAVEMGYGFSFWRATYTYQLLGRGASEFGLGGGVQIRNAVIDITDAQASVRRTQRNIGPVPLLRAHGRLELAPGIWAGAEVDGFWAPIKYLNGANVDVNGAIIDASVRVGTELTQQASLFVNVRYLGGGATGTSKASSGFGDGYTNNWLHFMVVSLGAQLR